MMRGKDTKTRKPVVAIVAIIAIFVGVLVFGVFWLFGIGPDGGEPDYHDMDEQLIEEPYLEEPYLEEAAIEEPGLGESGLEVPNLVEPDIRELDPKLLRALILEQLSLGHEPHIAAVGLFEELVWEMDSNSGIISSERVREVFGNFLYPCEDFEDAVIFVLTSQLRIRASYYCRIEGVFDEIHMFFAPMFMFDAELTLDEDLLRSYSESPNGLTYEYLVELIGAPGGMVGYRYNAFTYRWSVPDLMLNVVTDRDGVVHFMSIRERGVDTLSARLDGVTPEIRQELFERFANLASEMDENGGYTTRARVVEVFGNDYREFVNESPYMTDFFQYHLFFDINFDLTVRAIGVGHEGQIVQVSIFGPPGAFYDEGFVIDGEVIREYWEAFMWPAWEDDDDEPDLNYFEDLFGRPGTLVRYTNGVIMYSWLLADYGLFIYSWVSADYTVTIDTDRDGAVRGVSIQENRWWIWS